MVPVKTKDTNIIYGENQKEYLPLPAFKNTSGDVVTCWELTDEEIEQVIATKKIFLFIKTFNNPLQPVSIHTKNPIIVYTPLKQTRLNTKEQPGNCYATVLACLMMESSPENVLQIQEHYKKEHWPTTLNNWLENKGWKLTQIDGHLYDDSLYLVTGNTARDENILHICIYQNGELVHDPHPDNIGIKTTLEFQTLTRIL